MCYYNGQKVEKSEHIRLLQLEKLVANYSFLNKVVIDGFDYGTNAVLKPKEGKEDFDIVEMEWGFIPSWMKTRADINHFRRGGTNPDTGKYDVPYTTLNAVGEEVLEKKMYKKAAMEQRCLVLSSGFFEWRHIFPLGKKTGKPLKTPVRYPYYIHLPANKYFFMAGIWNPWHDKERGEIVESNAILTTGGNNLMTHVHNAKNRMPTILSEELAWEWMFGNLDEKRVLEIAATQYPWEKMYAYSLAKDFLNSNDPLLRVNHPDLPSLPLQQYEQEDFFTRLPDTSQGSLFG